MVKRSVSTKTWLNCKDESENRVSTVVTLIKPFRRHFLMHSAKIIIRKKKFLLTIAKMTNQLAKQKMSKYLMTQLTDTGPRVLNKRNNSSAVKAHRQRGYYRPFPSL